MTTTAPSSIVPPRVGGVTVTDGVELAWTGGGTLTATKRTAAHSRKAYRPTEHRAATKTEEQCIEPLVTTKHLATPDQVLAKDSKLVSFKSWISFIKREMEVRGMDSVFRIMVGVKELYILDEFGLCEGDMVETWVKELTDGTAHPTGVVCQYDIDNLDMSGSMILESLTTDMLLKIQNDGGAPGSTGPQVFAAVVRCHQSLTDGAVRAMITKLQGMSLKKEPKEDVETFADKVIELAKRISGTGKPPNDLHTMVYETFKGCSHPEFAAAITNLNLAAVQKQPNIKDWEPQLLQLKHIYREFKERDQWEGDTHFKEVAALKAAVKKLEKNAQAPASGTSKRSDDRECYHCGKKGHIKPNCPDKDTPKDKLKAGQSGAAPSAGTAPTSAKRTPPKDGESHTKTMDGSSFKWCATCKKWNSGDKAHFTSDHKKGAGKAPTPAAAAPEVAAALAVTDDHGPSLRLIGGFMASVMLKDQAGQR